MQKPQLKIEDLLASAKLFCEQIHRYKDLFGVTDGKAVGTFVELKIRTELESRYEMEAGSAALGLDIPSLQTDIKATSIKQPQSSCPFRNARQKIYGLGYNILLFVYEKKDDRRNKWAELKFVSCAFVEKSRTADYQTTRGILEILERDGNRDDIIAFLEERKLPGDEIVYNMLADEIMQTPPEQGYLTISNALQWRLQYARIVKVAGTVTGIKKIV